MPRCHGVGGVRRLPYGRVLKFVLVLVIVLVVRNTLIKLSSSGGARGGFSRFGFSKE